MTIIIPRILRALRKKTGKHMCINLVLTSKEAKQEGLPPLQYFSSFGVCFTGSLLLRYSFYQEIKPKCEHSTGLKHLRARFGVLFICLFYFYWSGVDVQWCVSFCCTLHVIHISPLFRFSSHRGHHRVLSRVLDT